MRKLLIMTLCLSILGSCVSTPAYAPQTQADPITAGPTAATSSASAAAPAPEVTAEPVPAKTAEAAEPAAAAPTAVPDQTYAGSYFQFDAPGDWLRAEMTDGVYFYPDPGDTQSTSLCYQEADNAMGLSETALDIALMFSSKDSVTAMVEGALTNSGLTNFKLSPVSIEKTKLNGLTCYKGASDITRDGQTYDFVGHIFLKKDKMVLLIWVGDQSRYAAGLETVLGSFRAVK